MKPFTDEEIKAAFIDVRSKNNTEASEEVRRQERAYKQIIEDDGIKRLNKEHLETLQLAVPIYILKNGDVYDN